MQMMERPMPGELSRLIVFGAALLFVGGIVMGWAIGD
jgi:hypothetical protein